jgi:hypothetical protein
MQVKTLIDAANFYLWISCEIVIDAVARKSKNVQQVLLHASGCHAEQGKDSCYFNTMRDPSQSLP